MYRNVLIGGGGHLIFGVVLHPGKYGIYRNIVAPDGIHSYFTYMLFSVGHCFLKQTLKFTGLLDDLEAGLTYLNAAPSNGKSPPVNICAAFRTGL
jgi:hypothetical protein